MWPLEAIFRCHTGFNRTLFIFPAMIFKTSNETVHAEDPRSCSPGTNWPRPTIYLILAEGVVLPYFKAFFLFKLHYMALISHCTLTAGTGQVVYMSPDDLATLVPSTCTHRFQALMES